MSDRLCPPTHRMAVLTRRECIASALAVAFGGLAVAGPAQAKRVAATCLVVGDSLSAEYGLRRGTGWVALLQERLKEQGSAMALINASISGDTTAGGRARLAALLARHRPTHVILELGGNDALRGLPLPQTEANLLAMAQQARAAGAKVMVIGMQVPPNYGAAYGRDFSALFARVAQQEQALLLPFLLTGVADDPQPLRWFQADRIHPNEAAHPLIMENVWRTLQPWLRA